MVGRETRITILILFAFVWVIGTVGNGYGGPPPAGKVLLADRQVSTSEVEIYRGHDRDQDNRLKMIDLCGRLEDDWTRAGANRKTEVEVHRETMKPGVTEYRREVSESNRFAAPADEQKTIELCRRLEDSAGDPPRKEVRVYRETTVPPLGRRSEVEIYRSVPGPDQTIVLLCRQLKADVDQDSIHNKVEVEEYTNKTAKGDEYSRQYHESSRYSATARDRDDMLVLCTQM